MRRSGLVFLLALTGLAPGAATAAEPAGCALKIVNTVPLTMAAGGARPLVTVTITGFVSTPRPPADGFSQRCCSRSTGQTGTYHNNFKTAFVGRIYKFTMPFVFCPLMFQWSIRNF